MLMCVRKAADPSGGTPTAVQASTLTSSTGSTSAAKAPSRRHKPVKPMRSRGGATNSSSKQQLESSDKRNSITKTVDVDCTVKVRDSPDGHLIYHKGDLVDKRCEFTEGEERGGCNGLRNKQECS